MRKLYLSTAILLLGISNGFAQNPNNHWQLGVSDVNFSTNPVIVTTIPNNGQYGNASISDDNGNLLFYTDGISIWNKNHQVMQDGANIGYIGTNPDGLPQVQPAIILPHPGNVNQFFVFTTLNEMSFGQNYQYSPGYAYKCYTVDFSDSLYPLGKVLANPLILGLSTGQSISSDFTFRPITSVKNSTNDGYFIIGQNQNSILSYQITSTGFNPTPIISNISNDISYSPGEFYDEFQHNTAAIIKFSPNNLKLGELVINRKFHYGPNIHSTYSKFFTLNFNNSTGVFSNFTVVEDNIESYGASTDFEFSSDSQKVYFVHDKVYVKDLSNISTPARDLKDLNNSSNTPTGFLNIQRDKYGNILISSNKTTNNMNLYIHKINNQDSFLNSSIQLNAISLNNNPISYLPQLIPSLVLACPNNITVFTNVTSGLDKKQSSVTITATNTISTGASAIYHAGNEVVLKPGFNAQSGSSFRAYIEGCSGNYTARKSGNQETEDEVEPIVFNQIKIYPNPSNGIFMVSLNDLSKGTIQITNLLGQTVFNSNFRNQNELEINMQDKSKGIYLVKVNSNNQVYTSKIIKK